MTLRRRPVVAKARRARRNKSNRTRTFNRSRSRILETKVAQALGQALAEEPRMSEVGAEECEEACIKLGEPSEA